MPGRGLAPQGRPPKQSLARTQLVVEEDDDYIAKSDKQTKQSKKKIHNFAGSVNVNAMKLYQKGTQNNKYNILVF